MLQRDKLCYWRCTGKEFSQLMQNALLREVLLIRLGSCSSNEVSGVHGNCKNFAQMLAKMQSDRYDAEMEARMIKCVCADCRTDRLWTRNAAIESSRIWRIGQLCPMGTAYRAGDTTMADVGGDASKMECMGTLGSEY
ncbi:hypothetical protein U1Q18_008701 [Sarracenia purpurea var. burkii]